MPRALGSFLRRRSYRRPGHAEAAARYRPGRAAAHTAPKAGTSAVRATCRPGTRASSSVSPAWSCSGLRPCW